MTLSTAELKARAKSKLNGNYGQALLAYIIVFAIVGLLAGSSSGIATFSIVANSYTDGFSFSSNPLASAGSLIAFLVDGALTIGLYGYFLKLSTKNFTNNNPQISDLFTPFNNYINTLAMEFFMGLFTFLWSLLFIVPGIIAALSYSMTPFILADHPEIKARDAMQISKNMMQGNKGKLVKLYLSFIGWFLLSILTFGIGIIFLMPYFYATLTEFFNEVSGKNREMMLNAQAQAQNGFGTANNTAEPTQNDFNFGYEQVDNTDFGYSQPGNNGFYTATDDGETKRFQDNDFKN